jgi:starch synthase
VIEDFLEPAGLTFEQFRDEVSGGWMFNYVMALRLAGARTVLICFSRSVKAVTRLTHGPTRTPMVVIPPPRPYEALRSAARFRRRGSEPLGGVRGRVAKTGSARLGTYLATPPRALARALRDERCAALLCQEYEYPRFDVCVALGRRLRLPVFGTFQGARDPGHALARALRARSIRAAAGLIVPSREEEARVLDRYAIDPERVARIVNPIDLAVWEPTGRAEARRELGLPAESRIAVWHGRVKLWEKGLDVLLDAWERIRAERPGDDPRLVLVGTGDDAAELHRRIDDRGIEGIEWIDEYLLDRDRMRRYLSAADVHVLPSRQEGLPVAALEAMACGLPVVAADASGVPDILPAGEESGGIVVPRDDAAAVARAVGGLLDDPERARAIGERGRRRVEEHFSLAAVGPLLAAFLLGETAVRPAR